jgi:hypothetical protein
MKHGKFRINKTPNFVRDEVEEILSMFEMQAKEKNILLRREIYDRVPRQLVFDA